MGELETAKGGRKLTLSVAICTFNGEQYLHEQLSSILAQSRLPDDLVISDDTSTDRTVSIARDFAQDAPFPVRIFVNEHNLGFCKNFERAIRLCEGDVIALADQDDVWRPEKLGVFDQLFCNQPDLLLAFSNADVVDEQLRPLGRTMWDAVKFSRKERAAFNCGQTTPVLLRRNVVQGASMVFRASLRPYVLPIPDGIVHDAWIALLASVVGSIMAVDRSLVLYRQHGANQLGSRRPNVIDRMRSPRDRETQAPKIALRQFEQAKARLENLSLVGVTADLLESIEQKMEHLRCRIRVTLRESGWAKLMFTEIMNGRYHRYSIGWWSVGHDLVRGLFGR